MDSESREARNGHEKLTIKQCFKQNEELVVGYAVSPAFG